MSLKREIFVNFLPQKFITKYGIGSTYSVTFVSQKILTCLQWYSVAKMWNSNLSGQLSESFFDQMNRTYSNPNLKLEDLIGFTAQKMKELLFPQSIPQTKCSDFPEELKHEDGWKTYVSVTIGIPEGKKYWKSQEGVKFKVLGLHC